MIMLKKRAQGLSITTIIVAVIGLIILVVIIMMITGKLGAFGKGVSSAASCENACKAFGKSDGDPVGIGDCVTLIPGGIRLSGTYPDVPDNLECCCYNT